MSTVADGWRLIREYDTKHEAGLVDSDVWDTKVEWGIHLISLEDMDQAKKIAKARGLEVK